jgi:hypothetical protein
MYGSPVGVSTALLKPGSENRLAQQTRFDQLALHCFGFAASKY